MEEISFRSAPVRVYGLPLFTREGLLQRLPDSLKEKAPAAYEQGLHLTGARIEFRTGSAHIRVRVEFAKTPVDIGMSLFASSSACVYAGEHSTSEYLGLVRAVSYDEPFCDATFENRGGLRDIQIYLPRNGRVTDVKLWLDDRAVLDAPKAYRFARPVVFYGSSITDSAHPSKTSNAYTAMLSRWLDFDYVNLGFGGAAKGELCIADFINTIADMSVFVYDYDHNAPDAAYLRATHEPFFLRIREKHPDTPVIMMSRPDFDFDPASPERRAVILDTYNNALRRGDRNVFFLDGQTLWGGRDRDMCTGDGTHPNDLGMYRMAQRIRPVLEPLLG